MSFRLGLILGVVILTASCGFRPLYAPSGAGTNNQQVFAFDVFRKIEIGLIKDREGQFLRNELIRLMHPSGRARIVDYDLGISLTESKADLAVRQSSDATRANLTIIGIYSLVSRASKAEVASGSVQSTSGYNIFESEFQTLSAEKSARERTLNDVAQQIRLRLGSAFATTSSEAQGIHKKP